MVQAAVAAWSGVANGRIPVVMMAPIGAGQVMEPHAAAQLLLALADMAAHGFSVPIVEGYRDYATQVQLRNLYLAGKGNVAAVPGTSNHGTGSAVDLGGGMDSWSSSAQAYWQSIEGKYGYSSSQGRADGEPWHKVCVQWLDNISNLLEATMTPDEHNALMQILSNSNAVFNAVFNGGGSMKDGHKSISQSLAEINSTVGLQVTRDDNGDGKLEYITQRQDNADTGTKVRDIEKKLDTVIAQTKK